MKELRLYRKKMLADFAALPDQLEGGYRAASSLPGEQKPEGRSAQQVLSELISMETRAFAPRLRAILDEDLPTFEFVESEAHSGDDRTPEEMIETYRIVRLEELEWIESMSGEAWSRSARHPWFGVRTFQWWVEKALLYAKDHVEELWTKV